MTGKDYVTQAWEMAKEVISEIRSRGDIAGLGPVTEALERACSDLEKDRNKATLRTRAGTNLAFPVYEAAREMRLSWAEMLDGGKPEAMREAIEGFCFAVDALVSALKERTVIMT